MQGGRYDWHISTLKHNRWGRNEVFKGNKTISNVGLIILRIKIEQ